MKSAIVLFPGTNRERDMAATLKRVTGKAPEIVWHGETRLPDVDLIVLFDPETVIDRATFEDPRNGPDGMPHVIVNGQFVVRNGEHTHTRAGRMLRRGEA